MESNLSEDSKNVLKVVLAAGSISSATDSVGTNTRRFYRVRLMD